MFHNLQNINRGPHCSHSKKRPVTENRFLCCPHQLPSCFRTYETLSPLGQMTIQSLPLSLLARLSVRSNLNIIYLYVPNCVHVIDCSSDEPSIQPLFHFISFCEPVNLIGVSAQGHTEEAANWNETLSICRLHRRPNQSCGAGGDRRVRVGSHRSSVGDAPPGCDRAHV
jgi:hypothetical protein